MVPLFLSESVLDVTAGDTILHHAIDESGIEVVACTDRADRRRLDGRIALAKTAVGAQLHRTGSLSVDKLLAIERYLGVVDLIGIAELVKYFKVLVTAPDNVGVLEILEVVGCDLHHLIAMGRPEVDVVVDDGTVVSGIVEQSDDLRTNHGIDGKKRSEDHDVIGMDVGIDKIELVVRMIFVEDIVCVVVVVEKGERHRRLRFGEDIDVGGIHAVVLEKTDDILSDTVVAGFTDESGVHAGTR